MSINRSAKTTAPYITAAKELENNYGQWRAYNSTGHCVVFAGPGSGKTKVLTMKVARMLAEDLATHQGIACITYSNECAQELRRRLKSLGVRQSSRLFIGTVHGFCLKHIVMPFAKIAGLAIGEAVRVGAPSENEGLMQKVIGRNERLSTWSPRISKYRTSDRSKAARERDSDAAEMAEAYESLLRERGIIDFDDIVVMGLSAVSSCELAKRVIRVQFPILVIDEYQDLGLPLHRIATTLCLEREGGSRLFAVGDADQSIYGFSGAYPHLFEELAKDLRVETVRLTLNYRSKEQIVRASEFALGTERGYKANSGQGGVVDFIHCPNGLQEQAARICGNLIPTALKSKSARSMGEIAVLYPTKEIGDVIATELQNANVPFIRIDKNAPYPKTRLTRWLETCAGWSAGGWSGEDQDLYGILSDFRLLNVFDLSDEKERSASGKLVRFLFANRDREVPLSEWLNSIQPILLETNILDPAQSEEVEAFRLLKKASSNELAAWSSAEFGRQFNSSSHTKLITLHSAKGLEFDVVYMMGMDQGTIPWSNASVDNKRESRRLFYVGLTRARYEVSLLYSGWINTPYGPKKYGIASEFVVRLARELGVKLQS